MKTTTTNTTTRKTYDRAAIMGRAWTIRREAAADKIGRASCRERV